MCRKEAERRVQGNPWRAEQEDKFGGKGLIKCNLGHVCILSALQRKHYTIKSNGVQTKCTPSLEQCCKPPEILQLLPVASLISWSYFINQVLKHNRVKRVGAFYKDEIEL